MKSKKLELTKFKKNKKFKTFINKRKNIILIVLGLGLIFGGKYANAYYQEKRLDSKKQRASEKQQELMKDFWQKKGLSEEEMQEKMKEGRGRGNFDPSEMTDEEKEEMKEKMEEKGSFGPGQMGGAMKMMH